MSSFWVRKQVPYTYGQSCMYGFYTCLICSRGTRADNWSFILSSKLGKWDFYVVAVKLGLKSLLFIIQPSLFLSLFFSADLSFFFCCTSCMSLCVSTCVGVSRWQLKFKASHPNNCWAHCLRGMLLQIIIPPPPSLISRKTKYWNWLTTICFGQEAQKSKSAVSVEACDAELHLLISLSPSLLFPDAEWIAHSEQLCHSTQHPSLPPSHPSVTLHGVQRHHVGLCDRSHMAAGQWQCSISPQLWHRQPSGLQEHDSHPWRHPPAPRLGAVKSDPQTWWENVRDRRCGVGGGRWGGEGDEEEGGGTVDTKLVPPWLHFILTASRLWRTRPQDPYIVRVVCVYVCETPPPPPAPCYTHSDQRHTRNKLSVHFFFYHKLVVWKNLQGRCTEGLMHDCYSIHQHHLSDSLLHTSANVFRQNGVMYNFQNKQSKKRGKKLCISVSGCLSIAIVFF